MEAGPGPGPLGAAGRASCLGRNQRGWAGRMGLLQRTGAELSMDPLQENNILGDKGTP